MPRYEWRGSDEFIDNRNSRVVEPGDVVDLDAHAGDPHPGMVRVDDAAGDTGESSGDLPFDPGEKTVAELRDAVQGIDDHDVLESLAEAEANGKHRETALDAIDAQVE